MGKFLDSFRDYLEGSRSSMTDLPTLFPPADLEHLKKVTRLEELAEQDGKNEYPDESATELSKVELDIRGRVEELKERYLNDYEKQLSTYSNRINLFNSAADLNTIDAPFKSLLSNLKSRWSSTENELYSESQALKAMANEAKNFRKENQLDARLPNYAENMWMIWVWTTILALAEIPLNFFLLREAGDAAQVLVQSVLYGLINVVLPVALIADYFRYANHVEARGKVFGFLIMGTYIVFILCVNLLMAHYRGVIIETSTQMTLLSGADQTLLSLFLKSQEIAFTNFANDMFGLKDIWSWFLFVGGCGLSLIGVAKRYQMDDSYPRYGHLKRRYDEQNLHYMDAVDDAIDELQNSRDQAVEEIMGLQDKLANDYRMMPAIIQGGEALQGRCEQAIDRLSTDFEMLVQEYRRINEINRQSPVPSYFRHLPGQGETKIIKFTHPEVDDPGKAIERLLSYSRELYELYEDLAGRIESTRKVLEDDYPFQVRAL